MEELKQIVFDFFSLCKLKPLEIRKGVWQVHVPEELARELDGWRAKGGLFQFTFDKRLADNYGAELISAGSYRLDSILKVIRDQAVLADAYLPASVFYEPNIRHKLLDKMHYANTGKRYYVLDQRLVYGLYFWFILQVSHLAYEKREVIKKPLVDLSTGNVLNYEIPEHLLRAGCPEGSTAYKRRLSFKKAYERLQEQMTTELEMADTSWALEALKQLEDEKQQIEEFYGEHEDQEQKELRLHELFERCGPKIQVRPLRGATLYLPQYEYKVMEVGPKETVYSVSYDPVSNKWQALA